MHRCRSGEQEGLSIVCQESVWTAGGGSLAQAPGVLRKLMTQCFTSVAERGLRDPAGVIPGSQLSPGFKSWGAHPNPWVQISRC